ncbi:MAG: class I SAM-dependent RNA methyltransferase [Acidobacteria bacterium]|nr:MAG: class I SAM-dependent RNA methyltransferase [Acidobacteriota bacterium]
MPHPINVRIEKLVYGGEGLAHHEGHTVFAPFVLPDESVSIEPVETRKKFIRGRVAQIKTPSTDRAVPPCPYFGVCGGCNYQHIPYELQLRYKAEILRETLSRLGRLQWDGPIVPHASPPFGYRNRVQWKIARDEGGSFEIGYFQAGSQKLCAIRQCPIASPRLNEALGAIVNLLPSGKLSAGVEIEVFADQDDTRLLLNAAMDAAPAETAALLRSALPSVDTLLIHDQRTDRFELSGPGHIDYRVGDHNYRIGHLSFFQVNRFVLDDLVRSVIGEARGKLALDLFAGVGLFSVPLANRFERLIAVESNIAAARDLQANLQASGAASPNLRQTTVEAFLEHWHERPDLVVLDPPRTGVAARALARLIKIAPEEIVYLSCDPATLARDLAILAGETQNPRGYRISELHLVDIFPQTYHIEALVRLSRRA